jgi:hypothetical protein
MLGIQSAAVRHQLNAPRFAAEAFDDEVIVLDLEGGVYYSLEGLAAWMFRELSDGATTSHVLGAIPEGHRESARDVYDRLVAEHVLVGADGEGRAPAAPPAGAAEPRLTRYDDLQLLLQIDPVHDVDATGWPNATGR